MVEMRRFWFFGVIAASTMLVTGCSKNEAPTPTTTVNDNIPGSTTVNLLKGQAVDLILAKRLDAGSCKVGDYVPLIVAEDVTDRSGKLAFAKGAVVDAEVSWSRSEGTLSGIMKQPARLEIRIKGIKLDETQAVALASDENDAEKPYAFTRANTGVPDKDNAQIDEILKNEVSRQTLEQLTKAFNGEEVNLDSTDAKMALENVARQLGMEDVKTVAESSHSNWMGMSDSIKKLQKGSLVTIAAGEGAMAVGAVLELANLAGEVGGRVTDKLKGRTIRAFPGTKLRAYIAEDSKFVVMPK